MSPILTAIVFLTALCAVLGLLLAIARRFLAVEEDPRIEAVAEMLPGANCGACGLPGCRSFAEKTVAGEIQPSGCPVGGPEGARFIANYLGVAVGSQEKKVARLMCAGGRDVAIQVAQYVGFPSCRAAHQVAGGPKGCTYGCLGLGECAEACKFGAIRMLANGLPGVDPAKCTACGDCVRACPRQLFEIMPSNLRLLVQCKSLLAGDAVLENCKVGCTACGRCVADAPTGLIKMVNNLAVIQVSQCALQTPLATLRCPTGAIRWVQGRQFPTVPKAKPTSHEPAAPVES